MDKKPRISHRAITMPASPIRKLVAFADEAKKKGVKVYHLNIGQPDIATPAEFMDAIRAYDRPVLEYGHSKGSIEYRRALVEYYARYDITLDPEEIMVTTGGSEAIIFAMLAACSTGEAIIVPEPFYTNYLGFSVMADIEIIPLQTKAEDGYHLPPRAEIESKITPNTRAILLCSPNNPTGTIYTRKEYEMVAHVVREHDMFLLSDEVYREFIYEGEHTSVMTMKGIEENAILLDSVSKRYSACGARVGCLASKNKEVLVAALKFGQARLCPPSIEQVGALAAVRLGKRYFQSVTAEYKRRRDAVYEGLQDIPGAFCVCPPGAFYIMARLPVDDTDEFAKWMLTNFSVKGETTMVAPGAGFYATPGMGKNEIRIAYVLNVRDCKRAMEILRLGVEEYNAWHKW